MLFFVLFFLLTKMFRLVYLLISLEFFLVPLLFFFIFMNKMVKYVVMIFLGVFSSVLCVSFFLKFIMYYGSDFVKF